MDTDVAYTEYALPKPEKPETGEKPETAKQYTIRAGDTLWDIAQKEKTTVGAILALNPEIKDASRIYPGQVIRLPGKTSVSQAKKTVTVKAGDTLSEIAAREGISLSEILRLNPGNRKFLFDLSWAGIRIVPELFGWQVLPVVIIVNFQIIKENAFFN